MAEVIDDWDFSSPPGSPSSSLPQSIREVLESVRAECELEDSGAFYSSDVSPTITWSNRPYKAPIYNTAFDDFDTNRSISRAYSLTQSSALQKNITTDQEQLDQRTSRLESHPFYQSNVQKSQNNQDNDVEKYGEPHDDIVMIDLKSPVQAHPSSAPHRVEQSTLTSIPLHEPAEADQVRETSSWPADDGSLCTSNVPNRLGGKQEVDININCNTSGMSHGLNNGDLNDMDPIILRAQLHPLSQSNVHERANYQIEGIMNGLALEGVQNNRDAVTADVEKKAQTQLKSLGTQLEHAKSTGIPWYELSTTERKIKLGDLAKVKTPSASTSENPQSTSINYSSPATRMVYGNSDAKMISEKNSYTVNPMCDTDNIVDTGLVEDSLRTARNARQKEENQDSKIGSFTKQVQENEATEIIDLTESPKASKSVAGDNINTQQETTRVQDDNVDIGLVEDWIRTARDVRQKEENQDQSKYGGFTKQVRVYEAADIIDLTDSLKTSNSVAGDNINKQQETTTVQDNVVDIGLAEDRIRTARNVLQKKENLDQSECGIPTKKLQENEAAETVDLTDSPKTSKSGFNINMQHEMSGGQGRCSVSTKSTGEPEEKSAELDSYQRNRSDGSVTSIEADQLDEVCYTDDRNSKENPNMKMGSNKFKPGYKSSADLRDVDFSAVESKKIKLENFSDDEIQPKEAIAQSYTNETEEEKFNEHSKTNPAAIWKQEILSSDFNLMYGSLRAILMGTISKEGRNRLVQTMIATMSEIEQVTMHERNPTEQSVRCETPELNDMEDEKNTTDSSEKEEIAELSVKDEKAAKKRKLKPEGDDGTWSLRKKELFLNQKRLELLMEKNADGSWTCLVCDMVREVAFNGVCRACLAFTYRIERAYTIGIPLPTCDHAKYVGGTRCKSCRFRKFSFMSMTATDTRVREFKEKTCPVCEETSYSFRNAWQCSKCYYFFRKLVRHPNGIPHCQHSGEFPKTCDGCRCYKLQVRWHKFETRPYPLPIVKKNLFYDR